MRAEFGIQQIRFAAIEVFSDRAAANQWLQTENPALGGLSPTACAQTKTGVLQVLGVLNAISAGGVV